MVLTASNMIQLGTKAPEFTLPDVISGENITLSDVKSIKATVIIFMCNHCPYVKHIIESLATIANAYTARGIQFIAINSNDYNQYPDDSPEEMKKLAEKYQFQFPYCIDETQSVAKTFEATCTPDIFVYDGQLELVYRGQFDDSRPGNDKAVTGQDLSHALEALIESRPIHGLQKPSIGCNIKWRDA